MTISHEYAEELGRQIDELEAENERLRGALEECVQTLAMAEHPARVDPQHGAEVAALGDRIGFGALMYSASASWRAALEKDGLAGMEFVSSPCRISVVSALKKARAALAAQPPSAPVEPYAWVIPGDDQARDNGSIDAMAWQEGEFTKPLYTHPPVEKWLVADIALTPDLMNATTVSCTGLEITIACNDHDTKDALLDVLVDAAYTSAQPHNALAMTDDQLFDIAVKAWESQTSHEWYTDALEAVISAVRDALASH